MGSEDLIFFLLDPDRLDSFEDMASFSPLLNRNDIENRPEHAWYNKCLPPTDELTGNQWAWIFKHTLICSLVCFGVNFALCTLSFYKKDDPTLFDFPTPVAGTYAITVFIEITLNWFINGILMSLEVLQGKVAPLSPNAVSWWPKDNENLLWYCNIADIVLPSASPQREPRSLLWRIYCSHLRSLPWMAVIALTYLPIFTVVTWVLYGMDDYNDFPQPEFLVAIFGFFLAAITMPFWGIITLAYIGSHLLEDR